MKFKNVCVTGGAGYVGSKLVPKLLEEGYNVSVLDLMIYGTDVLSSHPNLTVIEGDIRNQDLLKMTLKNVDCVVHLACISNDPSFELNPKLGKSINLDSFKPLVDLSTKFHVKRFIYASSSSVYGVKTSDNVTEDMGLEPLTDYSLFKAQCERILLSYASPSFETVIVRPATVCGVSRRQRLDVVVNILTNLAFHKGLITVHGGDQLRPNLHIDDMVDAYVKILSAPKNLIHREIFNVGFENTSVIDLAKIVQRVVNPNVKIIKEPTIDSRSYHISAKKIERILGFTPKKTIEDAVLDLKNAFRNQLFERPLDNEYYFNISRMKSYKLE